MDSVSETNSWTYQITDLGEEKIMGNFNEKEFLLSRL